MSLTEALLAEFGQEWKTTRRVLERVPTDRLSWKPHPKSMSLGTLALHVATSPGQIAQAAKAGAFAVPTGGGGPQEPASTADVLAAHDASRETITTILDELGDEGLARTFTLSRGGVTLMEMPVGGLLRTIMLNHNYHHRGQLSVYLRLLDVPVPSIYGPSADENPFVVAAQG